MEYSQKLIQNLEEKSIKSLLLNPEPEPQDIIIAQFHIYQDF